MLDPVAVETERIDSRFLGPACGSRNFFVPNLERKLAAMQAKYGRSDPVKGALCAAGAHQLL